MSHFVIEHFHGAASRVPISATACAMRVTGFNVAIISQWMDPRQNDPCIAWCRGTFDGIETISRRDPLCELSRSRRSGRSGGRRLRAQLQPASGAQGQIRSRELLPRERQYSPGIIGKWMAPQARWQSVGACLVSNRRNGHDRSSRPLMSVLNRAMLPARIRSEMSGESWKSELSPPAASRSHTTPYPSE